MKRCSEQSIRIAFGLPGALFALFLLLSTAAWAANEDAYDVGPPSAQDDGPATAKTIATNGTPQASPHTIHSVDDQDWVKFTIQADSQVVCTTLADSQSDMVDTLIILYPEAPGQPGVLDVDGAIVNDNNPLILGTQYSGIQAFLQPGTYYLAVLSKPTYFAFYSIGNYQAEAYDDNQYRISVLATPLPAVDTAPDSIEGTRIAEMIPQGGGALGVSIFSYSADTYEVNIPSRAALPYTFAPRGVSTVTITRTQEDNSEVPGVFVFESPRGGWSQSYTTTFYDGVDPRNDTPVSIPVLSDITTRRFILEDRTNAGLQESVLLLRDDLHAQGHAWTYSGKRTFRDREEVSTDVTWTRTATGKEAVKTQTDADTISEQIGSDTWKTHWLQVEAGSIGSGLYLVDDLRLGMEFSALPVPYLSTGLGQTADFAPYPETQILKEGVDAGVLYDGFAQDYVSYLATEQVTVPFGTVTCEKIAVLRTWAADAVGFGYCYCTEWYSPDYGLIKREYHEFAFMSEDDSTTTEDGFFELSSTNVPPRPPIQADFDVDFLVELGEGVNSYAPGFKQIVPRWLLRMVNAGPEVVSVTSVTFTNDSPFADLSPAGAVVSGDETVWSDIDLPANGGSASLAGRYTTPAIDRNYVLSLDRSWGPVMVGDGDEVEAVVTVNVQSATGLGDAIDIGISFLGTDDHNGESTGQAFANLTHVSSYADYDQDDGILAIVTDTPRLQSCRWTGLTPARDTDMVFKCRVRFDLLPPYRSALVEPIVTVKSKNSSEFNEAWNGASLDVTLDGSKTVEAQGVRIEPQDGYIAANRVVFHHQHLPYEEDRAAILPTPVVDLVSVGPSEGGDRREYIVEVANFRDYPQFLFDDSPFIDAGTRTTGRRLVVSLRTAAGVPIAVYEFDDPVDMTHLFFDELIGNPIMDGVIVHLHDRLTGREYESDVLDIDPQGYALLTRTGWNLLSFPTGRSARGDLIEDTYGVGAFASAAYVWDPAQGRHRAWPPESVTSPETLVFWGYGGDFATVDFTPGPGNGATEIVFEHVGWDVFSVPAGADLTAEDVAGIAGVNGLWRWNPTFGRMQQAQGKLDHRYGYWILIQIPPVTVNF